MPAPHANGMQRSLSLREWIGSTHSRIGGTDHGASQEDRLGDLRRSGLAGVPCAGGGHSDATAATIPPGRTGRGGSSGSLRRALGWNEPTRLLRFHLSFVVVVPAPDIDDWTACLTEYPRRSGGPRTHLGEVALSRREPSRDHACNGVGSLLRRARRDLRLRRRGVPGDTSGLGAPPRRRRIHRPNSGSAPGTRRKTSPATGGNPSGEPRTRSCASDRVSRVGRRGDRDDGRRSEPPPRSASRSSGSVCDGGSGVRQPFRARRRHERGARSTGGLYPRSGTPC